MQIIENVWKFKQILTDLETTLNDYTVINTNHEEVTKKIVQKMADVTKVDLEKYFPQSQPTKNENTKKQTVSNDKHVLLSLMILIKQI